MHRARYRTLALPAILVCTAVAPISLASAACPPRNPPACTPQFIGKTQAGDPSCGSQPPRSCQGERGPPGPQGERGPRGARGHRGHRGSHGETGATGLTGSAGAAGPQGPQGVQGEIGAAGSTGAAGVNGANGTDGATGATGARGPQGLQGVQGQVGAPGSDGADGANGVDGVDGTTGPTGANGTAGLDGTDGNNGSDGTDGTDGTDGADGATGPAGPTGPTAPLEYAYVYNTSAETVAIGAAVTFDSNGEMTSGITHGAGTGPITLTDAGTYRVSFSASTVGPSQMGLFVDGTAVLGSTYGSGAGTQQNTGEVIVTTTTPAAALTLRDHTSSGALALEPLAGGTEASTNASVLVEQLVGP
jgi:hypothetical protein